MNWSRIYVAHIFLLLILLIVMPRLEDLFYGMGVDLVIEAHEHSYERLWPVYQSEVVQKSYLNPRASVHVISGAGGNGEGVDWMGRPNLWSAFRADAKSKNSYGRLSIVNRTHLFFDQVNAITKEVIDNFWLIQEYHGPFIPNVDCSKSIESHKFCTCPPPIHYISLLIYISVGFLTAVVVSILLCCYSCKCCRSCCCLKCCLSTIGTGNNTSCKGCYKTGIDSGSRPHYGHQILVNIDVEDIQSVNTDIEDLTFYQSTETNNSFETELLLSS